MVSANPFDVPHAWVASLLEAYVKAYQVPADEGERFTTEFRPVAEGGCSFTSFARDRVEKRLSTEAARQFGRVRIESHDEEGASREAEREVRITGS